jgi:hypothetical protein
LGRYSLHHQLFRLFGLLILPVLYLLVRLASGAPTIVESAFSNGLYPVIRNGISAVTRLVPFSLAEALIVSGAVFIVIFLVIRIFRAIFLRKDALIKLLSLIITLALLASWLLFFFYFSWGFNYYRPGIDKKLDLPEREYSAEELELVCYDLADRAARLREKVVTDEAGVFKCDTGKVKEAVINAWTEFGASRPSFKAEVPTAKSVFFSEALSAAGISGIFIPFTEEPNINVHQPSLYIPFSAAHETAHYMGFAREEDANFLAFLVLKDSADPALAYSAAMHALVHCGNSLAKLDRDAYRVLRESYPEAVERDLAAYSKYLEAYEDGAVYNTMNDLNDSYLKFNDQEKGVLSYEEDTSLILRYYDSMRFFADHQ